MVPAYVQLLVKAMCCSVAWGRSGKGKHVGGVELGEACVADFIIIRSQDN
jgi:hypothetical protein